jgi:HlyD family secretion protein
MNKKTKWVLISVILLTTVLAVLSKTGVFGKRDVLKVTAEAAARRTITETVSASGRVYPEVEVKVSPDISGEITFLDVKEGDTVKKGQLLARIYADIYDIQRSQAASGVSQSRAQVANSQAGLDALKAQLEQAEKTYRMQQQLFSEKVISQNEFNTAESAYKSAKANYNAAKESIRAGQAGVQTAIASLQRANKDLSRTAVVAPMNGVVSLLNVKMGERVVGSNLMAGTEMLRIADMSKFEVRVDVGENDIPKVKLGDSALIEVDAYGTRKFRGIVTQIASSNTGAASQSAAALTDVTQYKVYIRLIPESYADLSKKGGLPFRPGMTASADIQTGTHANVLSIPINAVTTRPKNEEVAKEKKQKSKEEGNEEESALAEEDLDIVVFILGKDNKVKKSIVTTGIQDLNYIEITGGLDENAEVISGPYEVVSKKLEDGKEVKKTDKKDLFTKD